MPGRLQNLAGQLSYRRVIVDHAHNGRFTHRLFSAYGARKTTSWGKMFQSPVGQNNNSLIQLKQQSAQKQELNMLRVRMNAAKHMTDGEFDSIKRSGRERRRGGGTLQRRPRPDGS